MFPPVLLLAAVAVGTVPGAAALASARWTYRSPAAAILLWQALGLSWGLAAVGALAALGAVRGRWAADIPAGLRVTSSATRPWIASPAARLVAGAPAAKARIVPPAAWQQDRA